jgi:hypothetical protein
MCLNTLHLYVEVTKQAYNSGEKRKFCLHIPETINLLFNLEKSEIVSRYKNDCNSTDYKMKQWNQK